MKDPAPLSSITRRVERACRHVGDLWFPANPRLLSRLRTTLAGGDSPRALDDTLSILEGDYALFMFTLGGLLKVLSKEGVRLPDYASPRQIIEQAGLDRLKDLLDDHHDQLSRHSIQSADEAQVARMREVMVSASASSTLAEAQSENGEVGFFVALLRQLGLTLIAWNYPTVFERATQQVRAGKPIDTAVLELLGFSPTTLAIAVTRDWGLPTGLQEVLEDEDIEDLDRDLEGQALSQSLKEICRIGEALARANEPELYPTARDDWEFAKKEISARLGPDGMRAIREAVESRFDQLIVDIPSFFRGGTILDPEVFLARHHHEQVGAQNPLVKACRLHVQERVLEVYQALSEGQPTQALLRKFAQSTVLQCGFSGGIVFTVDPLGQTLAPQLRIGTSHMHSFEPVPIGLEDNQDFVAVSYKSDQPVSRLVGKDGDRRFATLGTVFGYSQRVGVLYLEIPELVFIGSEKQHLTHLRALAITLTDILQLG